MNKPYKVEITRGDVNMLFGHVDGSEEVMAFIRKLCDQITEQRHPNDGFPDTPWNNYIKPINVHIVELDGNKDAQRDYIFEKFHEMLKDNRFDTQMILNWFNSQMNITGNGQFANMFNYAGLYTTKLDLSKWL